MTRRTARAPHTTDDDPLTLLASAIDQKIEPWAVERLSHYQARWVWPPTFKNGPEWQPFVEDIRATGIREPLIALPDAQVVDGGHRLDAARELGLETVPVRVLSLEMPLSDGDRFALENWAVMHALARRQLNPHEMRALIIDLEHAVVELQKGGVTLPIHRSGRIAKLAEVLGMSAAHAKQILTIAHRGSQELQDRVKAGALSVDAAYRILTGRIGEASTAANGTPRWQLEIDQLAGEATAMLSLCLEHAIASGARRRDRVEAALALETAADEMAQLRRTVEEWCDSAS
ncbi:MAG: ParB/RepB/Spo0J family partition protein [Candidatus Rokuibacteriota bacterium]